MVSEGGGGGVENNTPRPGGTPCGKSEDLVELIGNSWLFYPRMSCFSKTGI